MARPPDEMRTRQEHLSVRLSREQMMKLDTDRGAVSRSAYLRTLIGKARTAKARRG